MRTANIVVTVGLALTGACATGAGGTRGVTHREYVGSVQVIFTNATPQTMCELHMSYEDQRDMGDNWLPEGGLASGKSIEFKIKPGKYQATWNTCSEGGKPYFAGTMIGDTSIGVDQQTQLFTYVADTVAPTKRAPVLSRDYKIVKFSGQPIGPISNTPPVKVDAFAAAEASFSKTSEPPKKAEPAAAKPEKFSAAGMVDPKVKRTAKREARSRPSLDRKHDVSQSNVKYRVR
jgi:hypothetical protein